MKALTILDARADQRSVNADESGSPARKEGEKTALEKKTVSRTLAKKHNPVEMKTKSVTDESLEAPPKHDSTKNHLAEAFKEMSNGQDHTTALSTNQKIFFI
jgi:hypothetical protein